MGESLKTQERHGWALKARVATAATLGATAITTVGCQSPEGVTLGDETAEQRATVVAASEDLANGLGAIPGQCGDILRSEYEQTTTISPTEHEACDDVTLGQLNNLRAQEAALDEAFGVVEQANRDQYLIFGALAAAGVFGVGIGARRKFGGSRSE